MAIEESEIVTSPTLKPKKAARSEDDEVGGLDAPGRERQHQAGEDQDDARGAGGEHADLR